MAVNGQAPWFALSTTQVEARVVHRPSLKFYRREKISFPCPEAPSPLQGLCPWVKRSGGCADHHLYSTYERSWHVTNIGLWREAKPRFFSSPAVAWALYQLRYPGFLLLDKDLEKLWKEGFLSWICTKHAGRINKRMAKEMRMKT